jgi:hypothetical protein
MSGGVRSEGNAGSYSHEKMAVESLARAGMVMQTYGRTEIDSD